MRITGLEDLEGGSWCSYRGFRLPIFVTSTLPACLEIDTVEKNGEQQTTHDRILSI